MRTISDFSDPQEGKRGQTIYACKANSVLQSSYFQACLGEIYSRGSNVAQQEDCQPGTREGWSLAAINPERQGASGTQVTSINYASWDQVLKSLFASFLANT